VPLPLDYVINKTIQQAKLYIEAKVAIPPCHCSAPNFVCEHLVLPFSSPAPGCTSIQQSSNTSSTHVKNENKVCSMECTFFYQTSHPTLVILSIKKCN